MKNKSLTVFCLFAIVVSAGSSFLNAGEKSSSVLARGPYLSSVTHNAIVISWTTSVRTGSMILYGEKKPAERVFRNDSATQIHSVTLENLKSDQSYQYRVVAGNDTTAEYTFWTAPSAATPFTFVAYGDTRSDHIAHVRVLKQIAANKPRFVINSGDLVSKNTEGNWDDYFNDLCVSTSVGQIIPVYASPGNHESGKMYYDNLFLPSNNPQRTKAYYSFDYGSAHFVSVNTEIDYGKESDQYKWLTQDLTSPEAKSARFRIVFWHRPPYSSNNHGSDMKVRETLCPMMESNGVDIVLNGHDHCYERTKPINGTTYVVTGGGGAPLYDFKTDNDWTAYKEKAYHICNINIVGTTLTLTMIRDDGNVRDSFVINKDDSTNLKK
jgi:hypothetical protein